MPTSFVVDVERERILVQLAGEVSGPEILRMQAELVAHPDYSPDFDVVMDNRAVTRFVDVPSQVLWELAKRSPASARCRSILVTRTGSALYYGLSRMYQTHRELSGSPSPITICESLEEAEALLASSDRRGA